jgi:hypothetical protein
VKNKNTMKYLILTITLLLLCCFAAFSQKKKNNKSKQTAIANPPTTNVINTFTYRNRYYFYQAEADAKESGKWLLYIGTVTDEHNANLAASVKIFSTDMYVIVGNDKLANIRIQAAKPFDYSWAVSRTNFVETTFYWTDGKIKYALFGAQMQSEYASPVPEKDMTNAFDPKKLTFDGGMKIAINQFIKQFDKLFQYPENEDKKPKLDIFTNAIDFNGEKYDYELRRGFFNAGDDNLSVRKGASGLIYNTLVRIKDEKASNSKITIDIHHVLQNGLSWSVYASDYLRAIFDYNTGTITYSEIGSALPNPDENQEVSKTFDKEKLALKDAFEIAMQNLVRRYNEALPK